MTEMNKIADRLRIEVEINGFADVGKGTEKDLGVSREMLNRAVNFLGGKGYFVFNLSLPKATNPETKTETKVLTTSDKSFGMIMREIANRQKEIHECL